VLLFLPQERNIQTISKKNLNTQQNGIAVSLRKQQISCQKKAAFTSYFEKKTVVELEEKTLNRI
jgi:hypothetical protein